jgi:hypothetical protein
MAGPFASSTGAAAVVVVAGAAVAGSLAWSFVGWVHAARQRARTAASDLMRGGF